MCESGAAGLQSPNIDQFSRASGQTLPCSPLEQQRTIYPLNSGGRQKSVAQPLSSYQGPQPGKGHVKLHCPALPWWWQCSWLCHEQLSAMQQPRMSTGTDDGDLEPGWFGLSCQSAVLLHLGMDRHESLGGGTDVHLSGMHQLDPFANPFPMQASVLDWLVAVIPAQLCMHLRTGVSNLACPLWCRLSQFHCPVPNA